MSRKFWYYFNRVARFFGDRSDNKGPGANGAAFIVYNPSWPDPPQYWFNTVEEATREAEKLARKQPQDNFYVMKAVRAITAKTVTHELSSGGA